MYKTMKHVPVGPSRRRVVDCARGRCRSCGSMRCCSACRTCARTKYRARHTEKPQMAQFRAGPPMTSRMTRVARLVRELSMGKASECQSLSIYVELLVDAKRSSVMVVPVISRTSPILETRVSPQLRQPIKFNIDLREWLDEENL